MVKSETRAVGERREDNNASRIAEPPAGMARLDAPLSPAETFRFEFVALCRRHGFVIAPEGYDRLQIWPMTRECDLNPLLAAEVREWATEKRP